MHHSSREKLSWFIACAWGWVRGETLCFSGARDSLLCLQHRPLSPAAQDVGSSAEALLLRLWIGPALRCLLS